MEKQTALSQKPKKWVWITAWIAFGLGITVYGAGILLCGGSLWEWMRYSLVMCLLLLPGFRLCALLLPDTSLGEQLLLSFSLSLGLQYLSFITLGRLNPWAVLLILLPLAVWQLAVWWKERAYLRKKVRCLCTHRALPVLLLIAAVALFCNTFIGMLIFAHPSQAGPMVYHQDMMFSVGNAAAVQLGAPLADLRASGGRLCYHFLGDMLPGFGAMFSFVPPYHAVCFYHDSFLLLMMTAGLYVLCRRFGASVYTAAWMPFCYLFLNGWNTTLFLNLFQNLNGLVITTILTAAVLLYVLRAEQQKLDFRFLIAFALSMLTLLMSKNVYGILIGCGLAAAVVFGLLIQQKFYRNGLILGGITAALIGLCWIVYYQYAFGALEWKHWFGYGEMPVFFLKNMPVVLGLWVISAGMLLRRLRTIPFSRLVLHALALGALFAFFHFDHYSGSHYYFLLASILFFWICALDVEALFRRHKVLILLVLLLALPVIPLTVQNMANLGYRGFDIARHSLGAGAPAVIEPATCTEEDMQAAIWLREHMKKDEIFATDRNDRDPQKRDGTWHYYSALSGRQCFMESWGFAMTYGHSSPVMHWKREEVSDVIFQSGDAKTAYALAQENHIRYLLLHKPKGNPLLKGGTPVFENSRNVIYDTGLPAENPNEAAG